APRARWRRTMADFDDALLAAEELRRRAPEWGTLRCLRLRNHGPRWSLVALWSDLHSEPRVTLRAEGQREACYVNHCHGFALSARGPAPVNLDRPPAPEPATADELGF